eukprot:TRINITY_DN14499_c0_g1_i1.p3 TRINITY_DN14499_c0_g1~~TRINITY_DN14499_c0_g1_i1.p3  ORF type:complete len:149 (-),score=43.55 TRINITY_DN14499_c0_g1_i1:787-1233(-)
MAASLGSTAYKRWLSFLASANVAFEVGFRSFVDRRGFPGRFGEIPDLLRMCFALGGNPLAPMDGWLSSVFRGVDAATGAAPDGSGVVTEERLLAMSSFQNLYVGLSPYKSPAPLRCCRRWRPSRASTTRSAAWSASPKRSRRLPSGRA